MPPKGSKRSPSETDTDTSEMFKQILLELKQINSRIDNIEQKVTNIEDSLEFHTKEVDQLKAEVTEIKSNYPITQRKVEDLELQNLHKSVEIQGIPHESNENLNEIIVKMAEKKNLPIGTPNIDIAYRNKNNKSVYVKFLQTHVRQTFLGAFKGQENQISAKDLGYRSNSNLIYVNEQLSFETRRLFFLTRKFKIDHGYKYAWTVKQKVYLRKADNSPAIRIKVEDDLSSLK